ncbi:hypothetical protein [Catellatospora chokoriensis]|uniref:hypothetical protein n=1 Tax=Catellatospora chokoriensis TaxID=310353 RepID=UPI001781FBD9|nr:hypothetical protein [Catellatospora chokoriensis]
MIKQKSLARRVAGGAFSLVIWLNVASALPDLYESNNWKFWPLACILALLLVFGLVDGVLWLRQRRKPAQGDIR